jgi:hypothetical protein
MTDRSSLIVALSFAFAGLTLERLRAAFATKLSNAIASGMMCGAAHNLHA